ncbi:hypothetical protein PINS_up003213 [Pythium insidiosum]|nr:hypothetical protein PINS_up003213 [Pythium insidiosum]
MEIHLHTPQLRWHHSSAAPGALLDNAHMAVSLPLRDDRERRLPCRFTVPLEEEPDLLKGAVTFIVLIDDRVAGRHTMTLGDCVPVLTDTKLTWTQKVELDSKAATTVDIEIPVTTNRHPREVIAHALHYRDRAMALAQQLSLHRNTVAIGLLPPVLGCLAGVLLFSPVWVPLTIVVGVLGFPLWAVLAVGGSFLVLISAISAVVAIRVAQSQQIKATVRQLCQTPSAQFVLFDNAASPNISSVAELTQQAKQYVLADPSRKLVASLVIDFIGNATFVVPGLGELADMLWAPASATLVSALYSDSTPSAKYLAFIEEFLPFTDFIPTATLAWAKENLTSRQKNAAKPKEA